jgi:hypothetical protein
MKNTKQNTRENQKSPKQPKNQIPALFYIHVKARRTKKTACPKQTAKPFPKPPESPSGAPVPSAHQSISLATKQSCAPLLQNVTLEGPW